MLVYGHVAAGHQKDAARAFEVLLSESVDWLFVSYYEIQGPLDTLRVLLLGAVCGTPGRYILRVPYLPVTPHKVATLA